MYCIRNNICKCLNRKSLDKYDDDSIKLFSYKGYKCPVKIVNVYDGDTFTGVFQYKNDIIKYKFRCYGYDSPEMKPLKSIKNRDEIKIKAIEAKEAFISITNCNKSFVIVEFDDFDKYGRILAKVYRKSDNLYINDEMIKMGHGYEYYGKTKKI